MDPIPDIKLAVGKSHIIAFACPGTSGYQWFVTAADPAVVTVSRVPGTPPTSAERPGDSRDVQFVITATSCGATQLEFELARPWRRKEVVRRRSFVVLVT